jgi:hypothetical protein
MKKLISPIITVILVAFFACNQPTASVQNAAISTETPKATFASLPDSKFNDYWYAGKAEISSYDYTINRYDEDRKGFAVFVFVTEDLSNSKQVKLDDPLAAGKDRVPVLKLNAMQRFQTGIYDYSMMSSLFTPVDMQNYPRSLKLTTTVQDWCGHVFTQLNFKNNKYKVSQYSYFEQEGDKQFDTEGVMLEDEIFTRLRLNPESLTKGKTMLIPNLPYTRIRHKPVAPQNATIDIKEGKNGAKNCVIQYTDNKRRLDIQFEANFPYKILSFAEYDGDKKMSEGILKKTIMSPYWEQHDLKSDPLRKDLGL